MNDLFTCNAQCVQYYDIHGQLENFTYDSIKIGFFFKFFCSFYKSTRSFHICTVWDIAKNRTSSNISAITPLVEDLDKFPVEK